MFFGLFGDPGPDQIVSRFHQLWFLVALLPTISFLTCLRLPGRSPVVVTSSLSVQPATAER
jgi:hypothetical protein